MEPIRPTQNLHKFLLTQGLVTNTDYNTWAEKYSGEEGIAKIHSTMEQKNLNPGDIGAFRKTAFEAYEPVKKKEPSGPKSEAGSQPSVVPIAESASDGQGPLVSGATPFDFPAKIFNTKSKFVFDDVLVAAASKGNQPMVGDLEKSAMATFKLPTPITRPLSITGSEDFFSETVRADLEADGFRQVKKMATMDENQVSSYKLKAAEGYAKKAEGVQSQSLANLSLKYDGFQERFAKDMRDLKSLDTEEAKAKKSNDEAMLSLIQKKRKAIVTHYEQFAQDPDFQLLTNAQRALGNAQEFVNKTIDEINKTNAPKEAVRKKMQLASDLIQEKSYGMGGALNPMGRWAARKLITKGAELANALAMATPTDVVGMNPFDDVADGLNEIATTYFPTPTQLDKPVFELDPKSFRESFKGAEVAKMQWEGQDVDVIYAGGKPVQIRSESGRLLQALDPEQSKQIADMDLPTQRVTSTSQFLLNTISIAADMTADIYGGSKAFKALALGKSGGLAGIWSSVHNDLFKEYRDAGLPDDEARLASFISAGAIANIDWAFGGVERFIGGANPIRSGAVKKAQTELVARGGLNAYSASYETLKAYAKTVIKESISEAVLEPLAQKGVELAFGAATGDEKYQREYEAAELRDNLLYSIPIAAVLGIGSAKVETQALLGASYLKAVEDGERTSKYIGGLVKDGLLTADQAKAAEDNLTAARAQMGMLKDLEPEQKEEAARLIFLDAHWERLGKEAPPSGKAYAKAQQEAVQKELQQYLPTVPGQETAQPTEQNNSKTAQPETQKEPETAQPEVQSTTQTVVDQEPAEGKMTSEQAVAEIKAKKLNRAEGLNMGANQAVGTFVSTEETNRYSDKAKPVEVEVKNPYVSTDDPGLTGMREQVVKDNIDQFEPDDFVDENGITATEIPANPNIDDLSTKGNNKAAALVTKTLQDQGYDSIYFPESNVQEGELVVFNREAVREKSEIAENNKQQKAEQVLAEAQDNAKKAESDLKKKKEELATIEKDNAPKQMEIGSPGVEQNLFADDVSAKREEVKAAEKVAKDAREKLGRAEAQLEVAKTPANQTEIPLRPEVKSEVKSPMTSEQAEGNPIYFHAKKGMGSESDHDASAILVKETTLRNIFDAVKKKNLTSYKTADGIKSEVPFIGAAMNALEKVIELVGDAKVFVVEGLKDKNVKNPGGFVHGDEFVVLINKEISPHILFHEAIHILTMKGLSKNSKKYDAKFHEEIKHLYNTARKKLGASGDYGLVSEKEFVSEALSNPNFAHKLSQIKSQGEKSVKDGIFSAIRSLFSRLGLRQKTILDSVIDSVESHIARKPEVKSEAKAPLPPTVPLTKEQRALEVRRARRANISKQYKKVVDKSSDLGLDKSDPHNTAMVELMHGRMLDPASISKELGFKPQSTEMNKLLWLQKSKAKGGVTIENLAEQIWEEQGSPEGTTVQDYRNAIIDVIKSHEGRSSMEAELWSTLAKAGEQIPEDRASALGLDQMASEIYDEYEIEPEILDDAVHSEGISEDAVNAAFNEEGELDTEALASITEADLTGTALEKFKDAKLAAEFGVSTDLIQSIKNDVEKGYPPTPEWVFDNIEEYEQQLEIYNRLRSEKEIVNGLGGTTAANLNRPGPVLETPNPTEKEIGELPAVKSWAAQKKRTISKKIDEVKKEIKKDWDDSKNLGISPEQMYKRNMRLKKNTMHLAFLYIEQGVVDFYDFLDKARLQYTAALEDIFNTAKHMHQVVNAPLFFKEELGDIANFRKFYQDENFPILQFIREAKAQGVEISTELDAYMKRELERGKVESKRRAMKEWLFGRDKGDAGYARTKKASFFGRLEAAGFNPVDFNMYMYAMHAKERNARGVEVSSQAAGDKIAELQAKIASENAKPNSSRGVINRAVTRIQDIQAGRDNRFKVVTDASHMTDQEADEILAGFTDKQKTKLAEFSTQFREKVIHGRVNVLNEAGVVGNEAAEALIKGTRKGYKTVWEHYVPIMVKGDALEPGEFTAGGVRMKFNRQGTGGNKSGIQGLKVTDKYSWLKGDITNVVETAMAQYDRAVGIAENNKVRQSLYELIDSLKDRMGERGAAFKGRAKVTLNQNGEVTDYDDLTPQGIKDNSVAVYYDGDIHYVYLPSHTEDGFEVPHPIVTIFKRKPATETSKLMKTLTDISRMGLNAMRNLITTWNIGFGPVNFLSDIQDALQNIGDVKAEFGIDRLKHVRTLTLKNLIPAAAVLGGKKRYTFVDKLPDDIKDYTMGNYWQEAVENGMPISFSRYDGIDEAITDYEKQLDRFYNGDSAMRVAGKVTANVLGYVNDIFENQTRLAVYSALRQSGLTAEQASQAAKNISLNFEKKGVSMKNLNPFFLFMNAGIQGSFRTAKNLKNIKRTYPMYAARAAWIVGMRYATMHLSTLMRGDDDDDRAQTQIDKLLADSWKSGNYNIYPNYFDPANPITIRKPYSFLRVWDAVVESAFDLANDRITAGDAQLRVLTAMTTVVDPIGGGSPNLEAYIPTLAKIVVEPFVSKVDYTGRELIPFEKAYMPLYTQYNYNKSGIQNELAIRISEALAYGSGAEQGEDKKKETVDPTIDVSPASISYFLSQLMPGLPSELSNSGAEIYNAVKEGRSIDPGEIILARRFYRKMENNPRSDLALVYEFINRRKSKMTMFFGDKSTAFQKDMVMKAVGRLENDDTMEAESFRRMMTRLEEKYPEWF